MWLNFRTKFQAIQQKHIPYNESRGNWAGTTELIPWGNWSWGWESETLLPYAAKSNLTHENERWLYIQRRVVKKMVRHAKVAEDHRIALACLDNHKEFFGFVNKLTQGELLGPAFSSKGRLVTNDDEMAWEFNTYFINVFTVGDVDNIPDPVTVYACKNNLTGIDCSEPKVEAKLKPDKAAVSDGFLPKVLEAVHYSVVQPDQQSDLRPGVHESINKEQGGPFPWDTQPHQHEQTRFSSENVLCHKSPRLLPLRD